VPPEVDARTQRYKAGLPARCAARPQPAETTDSKAAATSPDARSATIDNHIEPH
jgi:hypothetical protein